MNYFKIFSVKGSENDLPKLNMVLPMLNMHVEFTSRLILFILTMLVVVILGVYIFVLFSLTSELLSCGLNKILEVFFICKINIIDNHSFLLI